MTLADKLYEDLSFAAPEMWKLHIERRLEQATENERFHILNELTERINKLPQPTLGLSGGVNRKAVLDEIESLR